jgi:glycerophosphoryl diester phosphodiesterase
MKKTVFISLLLTTLSSCRRGDKDFDIINLNNNQITVFGHGGMGISNKYPMNSLESILNCLAIGADGSEIDIQMTKDSVLVAFHDYDIKQETIKTGLINSYTWEEIKTLNYEDDPYSTYSIVSLNDILSNHGDPSSIYFSLDCKLYNSGNFDTYIKNFTNAIEKIRIKYNLGDRLFIESDNTDFLSLLQQKKHPYKLFIYPNSFEDGLNTALNMNLHGITIANDLITTDQIRIAHENNVYM